MVSAVLCIIRHVPYGQVLVTPQSILALFLATPLPLVPKLNLVAKLSTSPVLVVVSDNLSLVVAAARTHRAVKVPSNSNVPRSVL